MRLVLFLWSWVMGYAELLIFSPIYFSDSWWWTHLQLTMSMQLMIEHIANSILDQIPPKQFFVLYMRRKSGQITILELPSFHTLLCFVRVGAMGHRHHFNYALLVQKVERTWMGSNNIFTFKWPSLNHSNIFSTFYFRNLGFKSVSKPASLTELLLVGWIRTPVSLSCTCLIPGHTGALNLAAIFPLAL